MAPAPAPRHLLSPPLPTGDGTAGPPADPWRHRLAGFGPLSPDETALLDALAARPPQEIEARSVIHAEGEDPPQAVLLSGWGCRARILPDGRRQIIGFLLPGDLIGASPQAPAPCTALAITRVALLPAGPLVAADTARHPGLSRALRAIAQTEQVLLRDQIVRLGRQTAYERLASLLLEFHARLGDAGLVREDSFALPVSQDVLGDALGLSAVHVNRTLQQIRRDGLVDLQGKLVVIREPAALRAVAHWQALPRPAV